MLRGVPDNPHGEKMRFRKPCNRQDSTLNLQTYLACHN